MQRLKKKTKKEKKKKKKEKQKLLLLSRMELLGSHVAVCIVTTDDTETTNLMWYFHRSTVRTQQPYEARSRGHRE